jgi:hypothetical protein
MKAKRVGDLTQVAEHLPSKHEALSSNISTAKKERKKEKKGSLSQ